MFDIKWMKSKNIQNNEKKKLNLIDLLSLKYKDIKKNLKLFS